MAGEDWPLIERGQQAGFFRSDLPVAWHLAVILAVIHAASGELQNGRIAESDVEPALLSTVMSAVAGQSR